MASPGDAFPSANDGWEGLRRWGLVMKKFLMTVAAVALSASAAFGADLKLAKAPPPPPPPPSPWDVAFGGAVMSDYMFRGITQSGHNPSVAAYTELRYNLSST